MKLIWLFFCFYSFSSFSQTADSCISVKEGFVIKIIQNIKDEDQLTKSVDYLFFNEQPKIERNETPISLYQKNGQLINISAYRTANFKRSMTKGFAEFDENKNNVLKCVKNKSFNFEIYRVVMAFSTRNIEINSITSINETSHSYSYFKNLSDNQLIEKKDIISPLLIEPW